MKNIKFKTREEVINFLEVYNFQYYIPRLEEKMDAVPTSLKSYQIEISDENKVSYCCIDYIENDMLIKSYMFYDSDRIDIYYPTPKEGEENYKEYLAYRGL
ncbi:hypothetical protein C672_3522 [[Clostridium] bifermentans ATCC 638]|uniref:Uncharacterized protein n=1 Tax=Paraclostridium bifermentans ATCC 638 = DSM 14991 TaxID=1233171 RepID=T4VFW6_PARBF|nr:hypothetical protein [Paraclostridium bifermentans]EQK40020.1 hypothetical protein C672_3522 [[Clostridium] bifermentans ATCC 638] [Paraclostridium bifermentans ATCC 638 = DSM 14991]RIZ57521.1 hypothetical protein CHH45_16130 [Paraclostridium bifermentans]UAG19990.1 hypothetical protein KXZ80_17070 [Paraclostridium bifermentans]